MKRYMALFTMLVSFSALAQTCISEGIETAADSEFVDQGDGSVLHVATDLVWQRCALGQTWDGTSCSGTAVKYNWQEALLKAQEEDSTVLLGWRLPNIKELASITERQCVRPAINDTIFPNTPPDDFWTSTPSLEDPLRAWVVAFFNASHSIKEKDRFVYVRLVRTQGD
ncbi:DUF1566 domain-containing protein [Aestuariibacter sp. A3R04]|uniref:Lcl C-terminal domain-containing protein n=1 Tax=Aestuariibacter sp. A3R04 TaxID=2841571 RepID=UPI001C098C2D|nr:DUF1566 domain-containing protein [Aestuariibacter sp. A3R04]MBU3022059.1 DUF1566 domain-containing protein [Aestuariibacter sp. A3R04]